MNRVQSFTAAVATTVATTFMTATGAVADGQPDYLGQAKNNPHAGAPVIIQIHPRGVEHGYIVDVPQRNARPQDPTCKVQTDLMGRRNSQGILRTWGRAMQSQPLPEHSRDACCNIDRDFGFILVPPNGQDNIQLRSSQPFWCETNSGGGDGGGSRGGGSPGGGGFGGGMGSGGPAL